MASRSLALPATYDDLLAGYYGRGPDDLPPGLDALLRASPAAPPCPARAVTMSRDDGELLPQPTASTAPPAGAPAAPAAGDGAAVPSPSGADERYEEYVVLYEAPVPPAATGAPPGPGAPPAPGPPPADSAPPGGAAAVAPAPL